MDDLKEYRNQLIAAEQKAQDDFDKTILSLSSGALGVSFIFLNDIIGDVPTCTSLLMTAWVSWALSSTSVLISFYVSHKALRHAINQVDSKKIREEHPGSWYDRFTEFLNWFSLALFVIGLFSMIWFIKLNLEG
ncbi:MAG: hypothetical protein U0V48_02735 [Anaerolineales bacterium]